MSLQTIVNYFTTFIEKKNNEKKKNNQILKELKNRKKQFNSVIDAYFQVLKEPVPYGFKKDALDYLEKFVLSYDNIESMIKGWKLAKSGYEKYLYLLSNIEYDSDSASESGSDCSDSASESGSDYSDSGSESDSDESDSDSESDSDYSDSN